MIYHFDIGDWLRYFRGKSPVLFFPSRFPLFPLLSSFLEKAVTNLILRRVVAATLQFPGMAELYGGQFPH